MVRSVQAVILNKDGQVLAVSRKDNHSDFGLVGGKVDDEDYLAYPIEPLHAALIREVKEETGLDISVDSAALVLAMHKGGYMSYTFLVNEWSGDIETDEPHIVKWTNFSEIIMGSFGRYNEIVSDSLNDMGVNFNE